MRVDRARNAAKNAPTGCGSKGEARRKLKQQRAELAAEARQHGLVTVIAADASSPALTAFGTFPTG
jgi:hypothetical protein